MWSLSEVAFPLEHPQKVPDGQIGSCSHSSCSVLAHLQDPDRTACPTPKPPASLGPMVRPSQSSCFPPWQVPSLLSRTALAAPYAPMQGRLCQPHLHFLDSPDASEVSPSSPGLPLGNHLNCIQSFFHSFIHSSFETGSPGLSWKRLAKQCSLLGPRPLMVSGGALTFSASCLGQFALSPR